MSRWSAAAVLAVVALLGACGGGVEARPPNAAAGDVVNGRLAMEVYGCAACHAYPGSGRSADAYVGPPLEHWSQRSFIAGYLPNSQPNLVLWLLDPGSIRPGTAMPDVGLDESDARDIAAYLLSLR